MTNSGKSCELSALLYADSFFYGLMDYGQLLLKTGVQKSAELSTILSDNLDYKIRRTRLAVMDNNFVIFPEGSYTSENIGTAFYHSHGFTVERYLFRSDSMDDLGLKVVYAIDKEKVKWINQTFDSPSLIHFTTAMLSNVKLKEGDAASRLHVCLVGSQLSLVLIVDNNLKWCNTYDCGNVKAFLYYIGLVSEIFLLPTNELELYLSGWLDKDHLYVKELNKYFSLLKFQDQGINFYGVNTDNHQYYHPLVAISKCA